MFARSLAGGVLGTVLITSSAGANSADGNERRAAQTTESLGRGPLFQGEDANGLLFTAARKKGAIGVSEGSWKDSTETGLVSAETGFESIALDTNVDASIGCVATAACALTQLPASHAVFADAHEAPSSIC